MLEQYLNKEDLARFAETDVADLKSVLQRMTGEDSRMYIVRGACGVAMHAPDKIRTYIEIIGIARHEYDARLFGKSTTSIAKAVPAEFNKYFSFIEKLDSWFARTHCALAAESVVKEAPHLFEFFLERVSIARSEELELDYWYTNNNIISGIVLADSLGLKLYDVFSRTMPGGDLTEAVERLLKGIQDHNPNMSLTGDYRA